MAVNAMSVLSHRVNTRRKRLMRPKQALDLVAALVTAR